MQVHAVIGVLMDDTDPLVTVMKVEKAPQETYADIGGLDNQIQEIKVCPQWPFTCLPTGSISLLVDWFGPLSVIQESVELPLTHPEYYEEMGIKPPKGVILYGPPGTGKYFIKRGLMKSSRFVFLSMIVITVLLPLLAICTSLAEILDRFHWLI